MKVLLITPPMVQVNSPYPATAYLFHFLKSKNFEVSQKDFSLELFLRIFSKTGLNQIYQAIKSKRWGKTTKGAITLEFFIKNFSAYANTIEDVVNFLQGKNNSLALRINSGAFLPTGPRFDGLTKHPDELLGPFGELGDIEKAQYLCSLYIDDLADVIKFGVDADFEFSKYAERLASSEVSFEPLLKKLQAKENLIDQIILDMTKQVFNSVNPDVIGLTVPFPGNMYSALRVSYFFKKLNPKIKIILGGGYVNTELRDLDDIRIFNYVDFICYDDGETPLLKLLDSLKQKEQPTDDLVRTMHLKNNKIIKTGFDKKNDSFKENLGPSFLGLPLNEYISMIELPNAMHRMWSGYRWNKMILAHGCYWKKCSFCDIHLNYIQHF